MPRRVKISDEGRKAEKALRQAVANEIEKHRRLGLPIAIMQDGKATLVHPDDIKPTQRPKRRRVLS